MRIGSSIWRRVVSAAVPLAFAAALPLVQWCPLGADATLLDCLVEDVWPAPPATGCSGEPSECAAHETTAGGCPFERTRSRALCVGAPIGGPGLRPLAPDLQAPDVVLALPPMDASEPCAPREHGRIDLQVEARPPTRAWATHPPVRGPPSI